MLETNLKSSVFRLLAMSELHLEHMALYYTGTGDVAHSTPMSTWEPKPNDYTTIQYKLLYLQHADFPHRNLFDERIIF